MVRMPLVAGVTVLAAVFVSACSRPASPTKPTDLFSDASTVPAWGPEAPPFNLEATLRGDGFGLVKFRQPNDEDRIVYLDVWVRELLPATSYSLQRAVDTTLDGSCTGANWLTLGQGTTPDSIVTDDRGTGRASLWRNLGAFSVGAAFDIHFRVIEDGTSPTVVPLQSDCYRFVITQ